MADVIRNGINYGKLVINELDGVRFTTDAFYASMLALPVVEADGEIPEFNRHLHISTVFATSQRETVHFVFNNADVRTIAAALSRHTKELVRVCSHARILANYRDGELFGEIRTLDSFYSNLSQEEIDASTF